MDIVHLIETKLIKSSVEETSSCMYAEIEQTLTLDHSEGKPARGFLVKACKDQRLSYENSLALTLLPPPGVLSGFSALHEDIDSPGPGRHSEPKHRSGSGREVPIVLAEDLSTSLSSLPDAVGRFGRDSSPTVPSQISTSRTEMEASS